MKHWEFVQTGDQQQCRENGLEEHEYFFAIKKRPEGVKRSHSGYVLPSLGFAISLRPEYATSFRLTLTF